jgi:hypothetical protein
LLQEQLDYASPNDMDLVNLLHNVAVGDCSTFIIERAKVLLKSTPETVFAKSVAHSMRPFEYSLHVANAQQDSCKKTVLSDLASFLEEWEKSRLKVHPSKEDKMHR